MLAIDAGNSRIKWGWSEDGDWQRQSWIATAEAGDLGKALADLPPPDRVVVSNVAGDAVRDRIAAALRPWPARPQWLVSRARQCGVTSSYADPVQLGSDRWAALIGAWHRFHGPCVVVVAGTTMTVDALSGEGAFLGGLIVPGYDLMRASLARAPAQRGGADGAARAWPDRPAPARARLPRASRARR
ncbi:MAG: type III pantothenate kinase [Burkholderiales bacterium]|nr:type III pantothenate kinase [Burkholderiales bacterium]